MNDKQVTEALQAKNDKLRAERDRQYDENVNRIAAEGAAILRAKRAEAEVARLTQALSAQAEPQVTVPFQSRVHDWMMACFNDEIAFSRTERNHRFLEEALELVQSMGCTHSEAIQLVDYVFNRPAGEPSQEVGGVEVCLAALCTAAGLDKAAAGETELARIWTMVEKIRAKHAAKPQFSPLPGAAPEPKT